MSHLRAAAPAAEEGDRGRVTLSKVHRYRAGHRTQGADYEGEEEAAPSTASASLFSSKHDKDDVRRTPVAAEVIVKKADPRLARLAKTDVDEARGEGRQRHRCAVVRTSCRTEHSAAAAARCLIRRRRLAGDVYDAVTVIGLREMCMTQIQRCHPSGCDSSTMVQTRLARGSSDTQAR